MSYQNQKPRFRFRETKLDRGVLRVPVVFFSAKTDDTLDGRDVAFEEIYKTMANVYNPSLKDVEISRGLAVKARATIQIRDPLGTFQPQNEHFVTVKARRFGSHKWQILDIRPDFQEQGYITLLLGGAYDG